MAKADPNNDDIVRAEKSLDRHLQWIGRFDTRTSLVTGIAIAMLGVLATVSPPFAKWTTFLWVAVSISLACLAGSLASLFVALFPRTAAPNASLHFFGSIADMKADEFRNQFRVQTPVAYFEDLAEQCHVNARILARKFTWLKVALALLLLAAMPWALAVFLSKQIGQ
jgi:hypothetical protein